MQCTLRAQNFNLVCDITRQYGNIEVHIMIHVCRLVKGVTRIWNQNKLKGQLLAVGHYEAYICVCVCEH